MQAEMNKLFAEGGVMQEGGTVDPVSGNEVPLGAMKEEVRDDIDAKLSEGEFVFPADVVRFIGLQTLMKLRDKAKAGLKRMEDIGQMGNAEEVENGEALFGGEEQEDEMDDETFSAEIDSILAEDSGGEEREYAEGGYVGGKASEQLYRDAPIKGFEMVPMTNDAGQTIYIPFIDGVAQLSIPAGYKVKSSSVEAPAPKPEPTTSTPADTTGGGGGGDGGDVGGGGGTTSGSNISMTPEGAVSNTVSSTTGSVVGGLLGLAFGVPVGLAANIGKSAIDQMNFAADQAAMNVNVAIADTSNPANIDGVTTAAATPGATGTGGSAASAAADAAAAAAAAGHSPEAQGAASQAAADATIGGATPGEAAAAAADAANAAAADAADAEGGGIGTAATGGEGGVSGGVSGIGADGIGFAKGGFVSKRKSASKSTKQKGLASRK